MAILRKTAAATLGRSIRPAPLTASPAAASAGRSSPIAARDRARSAQASTVPGSLDDGVATVDNSTAASSYRDCQYRHRASALVARIFRPASSSNAAPAHAPRSDASASLKRRWSVQTTPIPTAAPIAVAPSAQSLRARSNSSTARSLWPRARTIQASSTAHAAASAGSPRASSTRSARVRRRMADACLPRAASRAPLSGASRRTRLAPCEGRAAAGEPSA